MPFISSDRKLKKNKNKKKPSIGILCPYENPTCKN